MKHRVLIRRRLIQKTLIVLVFFNNVFVSSNVINSVYTEIRIDITTRIFIRSKETRLPSSFHAFVF